jgi:predicted metal-dependent hydrolase
VHLKEEKHGEVFVGYMNKYMPNWQQYKEELNKIIL